MKKQLFAALALILLMGISLSAIAGPACKKSRIQARETLHKDLLDRSAMAPAPTAPQAEKPSMKTEKPAKWNELSRQEKKDFKNDLRERIKDAKSLKPNHGEELVIAVLLAIFLAPFGILYWEGPTTIFWIDLILWILGVGLVWTPFFYVGGLWLIATIIALVVVLTD